MFFTQWDSFLYNYHLYYRNLNESGKKRFVKRVNSILNNLTIIGKEGLQVTAEIKILVVANLVQLTFGLKNYWLYGYEYIYLYPESFSLPNQNEAVAGSTFQQKIIALSWRNFAIDHLKANDGHNISLAQYALGLIQTVFNGNRYDQKFGSYIDTWFEIINKEIALKVNNDGFGGLEYTSDNIKPTFAKCVELFFEKPSFFKKELPTSYAHFCLLLNQDPLNVSENYAYNLERISKKNVLSPLPKFISIHYKYKDWHWIYNLPFIGIFTTPLLLFYLTENLLVRTEHILLIMFIVGSVLAISFYKPLQQIYLFKNFGLLWLSSICGYGPLLVGSLLSINQIHGYDFSAEYSKHQVASYYLKEIPSNPKEARQIVFNFSDDYLIDFPKARTFDFNSQPLTNKLTFFNEIGYEIRHGLIGIPIVTKRELF